MTGQDLEFIRTLLGQNVIGDSVLELGSAYQGQTCKAIIQESGRRYASTDLRKDDRVDVAAVFEPERGCLMSLPPAVLRRCSFSTS